MTIELNIQNDTELRNHIKQAIDGQIKSLARTEFFEIVKGELIKKHADLRAGDFDAKVEKLLGEALKQEFTKLSIYTEISRILKDLVQTAVSEAFVSRDWSIVIEQHANTIAKEKLRKLIE